MYNHEGTLSVLDDVKLMHVFVSGASARMDLMRGIKASIQNQAYSGGVISGRAILHHNHGKTGDRVYDRDFEVLNGPINLCEMSSTPHEVLFPSRIGKISVGLSFLDKVVHTLYLPRHYRKYEVRFVEVDIRSLEAFPAGHRTAQQTNTRGLPNVARRCGRVISVAVGLAARR